MKYMLLIYSNPTTREHPLLPHRREPLSPEERDTWLDEVRALTEEITGSGELLAHGPLADPINTTTVRVRDRALTATDGPFLESKEHLAGYFVVDCDSVDRAVAIAARFPDARSCAVEVRPIMDSTGMEM